MFHRTTAEKIGDGINVIVLLLIAFSMFFPFYYLFATSFTSYREYIQNDLILWPKQWVADAYTYIFHSKAFMRSLGVTIYVTIMGTFVNLFFTSTMAYALSRPILGRKAIIMLVLFTFVFSAGIIPYYMIVKWTGLMDTLWSLILPVAINPFNLIVIRQFFLNIPPELSEASMIDGATEARTFVSIILPLSKPVLAAFGLFYAVAHWNNFFSAILYISDVNKWTIQVILRQIVIQDQAASAMQVSAGVLQQNPPPETIQMAAILVATVPILIVYPFLQKHFAKGVMIGSVKG